MMNVELSEQWQQVDLMQEIVYLRCIKKRSVDCSLLKWDYYGFLYGFISGEENSIVVQRVSSS
jgi:hypothetical protein